MAPLGVMESSVKYHPSFSWTLTPAQNAERQCLVGSLTGAVSSKKVSEDFKGTLSTLGNRALSAMAQGCLTARQTSRAATKVGHSDPVVLYGRAIAKRIKGTPGITG